MRKMPLALTCCFLAISPTFSQGKKELRPGEVNTPPAKAERKKDALKVGDVAPNFTLPVLKTKEEATLGDHKGKKPVVLIFGSYT